MHYVDIHSHYNLEAFDGDRHQAIETLIARDVGTIVVGVDKQSSLLAVELAETYPDRLFACVGFHPAYIGESEYAIEDYQHLVSTHCVVAIGECGLDYVRLDQGDSVTRDMQKECFREHIVLACESRLPLMLHIRPTMHTYDAYEDTLALLEEYREVYGDTLRGNAHFFVGTIEHARRFVALGFTVSFTGVITFTDAYDSVIKSLPLNAIMAETDAPFVAPVPYRGKRTEPWMVQKVYERIASIHGVSEEHARTQMLANVTRVFGIQT
jgi:TatD DNase family protein